ncbi:hypothetical protein QBC47DRAFT_366898 [Echria macrotheca]|uniref:Uncharacterized protein n=1 Tax=Echria macrotheca TaxID=438768 RepID=A0AAJ0BLV6_9PEZI|nr:hypothetical protein QBC47DRAFT_366898 [Echria macrotheca]
MHIQAIEQFQSKNRRSWVPRALRGKPKTYEQHVHEKCHQFPLIVQEELHTLLEDREAATSTNHHTRKWTIAVVDEEEPFRFSEVTTPKAKKHRKAPSRKMEESNQSSQRSYFVVIRGSEVKASSEPEGFTEFSRHSNPWVYSDIEEARRRDREHRRKMRQQRSLESWKRGGVSPAPPRRRARPAYLERERSRSRSPPSYRLRRDSSPGAESVDVLARAETYIRASRNAPPAVPIPPSRRNPIFHGAPPPPPPGFAMPMPGPRPMMAPPPPPMPREPPFDRDRVSCFFPAVPPGPPNGMPAPALWLSEQNPPLGAVPAPRPSVYVKPFQEFGYRPASLGGDDGDLPWTKSCVPPRPKSACAGCKVTPDCEHFSGDVCRRSMTFQRINGEPRYFHPDCFICMAKSSAPPANPMPPIPPMPTANSAELPASPSVGPPPYPSLSEGFRDKDCWGDTDIESDDESDDGEVSAKSKKDD